MTNAEDHEIEVIDLHTELQVFDPVAQAVADAKERCKNIILAYDTPEDIKESKSFIYQLRKLKAPINETHKMAKAEALKFTKALDAKKRELIDAVDEMIEEKYAPIREIEEEETHRLAEEALKKQQEEEAAERERLAEIEAKERELAEREAKIQAEKEKLARAERERQIAEEAKKRAEQEAKQAIIDAENARKAAEEKAKQDAIDAENRRLADIQREKDRAAAEAAEKERIAIEKQRLEQEAEEKRIADKKHRLKINTEAYEAIFALCTTKETAQRIFNAIYENKIPHVYIKY